MSEGEGEGRAWPWVLGGVGLLALAAFALRGRSEASEHRSTTTPGPGGVMGADLTEQAIASAAKEAADASDHGGAAEGPPAGELVHDEAREGRVLAALGLTREAWNGLDEPTQRAKAVEVLVSLGHFERANAEAAVRGWSRGDLLSQLAPVAGRDSAGIAQDHPVTRLAREVGGR